MGEVVLLEQCHHIHNRHLPFGGHQRLSLFGQWRVHTDSYMTFALVEKPLQLVLYSHTAHGDALGTPLVSPVGGEHLCSPQHIVEVVHRLALSHKHDVGEILYLGQGIYLIEYVGCCEVALESLLSRLAKQAVHLASHLRRHAERSPVAIGYIHSLNKLSAGSGKEVFHSAVLRPLAVYRRHCANLAILAEFLSVSL